MAKLKVIDESAIELLNLVRSGLPHKEIAEKLGVSPSTVSRIATANKVRRYHTVRSYNEDHR